MRTTHQPPWSAASAPIWSLVSGYASRFRADKPLAFFQAFTDDSASDIGDRRLFFAGYLNRAEDWALFADAWDEELRAEPGIEYLRMVEANGLRGQFAGWDERRRDEKLRGLARVIRHFKPVSFQVSVSREQFARILEPVNPRGLSPHFDCVFCTVSSVARFAYDGGMRLPIDFVFDEMDSVALDMPLVFDHLIKSLPRGARQLVSGHPTFKNDKLVTPLQAADMLAWHVRREHEIPSHCIVASQDIL